MIIKSSDFYHGLIPKDILSISFFKANDDYCESILDIVHRMCHKPYKIEVSFFKESNKVHYAQMERIAGDESFFPIKIIDDVGIFDEKDEAWISANLGDVGEGIVLYFDDNDLLQSITYTPDFVQNPDRS